MAAKKKFTGSKALKKQAKTYKWRRDLIDKVDEAVASQKKTHEAALERRRKERSAKKKGSVKKKTSKKR